MKTKERNTARILYVEQGKTAKEIAALLNTTEKTISGWVNKYGWKQSRTAKVTSIDNRTDNIKQIIDQLATDRIALQSKISDLIQQSNDNDNDKINSQIAQLRTQIAVIDSSVYNWTLTLSKIDKDNRITLAMYLYVMESVFKALNNTNPEIYLKTIEFQEQHINDISLQLG
jgi:predicted transcriptional regulator